MSKPEPGDRVTVRYTFTLPETEPEDGFKLPQVPLDNVNTVVVREKDAATRDDKAGTVRRMRDSGALVVKREGSEYYPWVSLDIDKTSLGSFSDEEVCGHSDYVGAVPGSEAAVDTSKQVRVWVDNDAQYWFELQPGRLTWGGSTRNLEDALGNAEARLTNEYGSSLAGRTVGSVAQEFRGRWLDSIVTKS